MTWKGRIIGSIIGFLFGGVGIFIGFAIGYFFFDKPRNEAYLRSVHAQSTFMGFTGNRNHIQVIQSTFRLMGYVARGAGRVNETHIREAERLMNMLNLSSQMRQLAIDSFNLGKSDYFNLDREVYEFRDLVYTNFTILQYVFDIVIQIALADDILTEGEHQRLINIASAFGFRVETMEALIRTRVAEKQFAKFSQQYANYRQRQYAQQGHTGQYSSYGNHSYESYERYGYDEEQRRSSQENYNQSSGNDFNQYKASQSELENAYAILGVTADTPWSEIRKAHKKLMLKYHPDRIAAQGLPPEMAQLYTAKAQDIQAAFALIKEARGES